MQYRRFSATSVRFHSQLNTKNVEGSSDKHFCVSLTLRLLMSYIYMEHQFLMFLDHTQRRSTVGRTPLDE